MDLNWRVIWCMFIMLAVGLVLGTSVYNAGLRTSRGYGQGYMDGLVYCRAQMQDLQSHAEKLLTDIQKEPNENSH